ncbi:MAG TPA: rhodanese [Planctomycetaceae bacterium]|nr:rhodanese [Blastopirellula sp.]HAY82711.1 rhodanese [Planctomycetaceae bacterium]|tara:strand:+ start:90 stop:425 length:336 start_codon:yes stop_codon:yes gene_type:complete
MSELPIEIDVQAVRQLQESEADFLLLDCREQEEYETARIEGAVLIPMSELVDRASELESFNEKHIVVHCHHGGRSLRVTHWLRGQGYLKTQNMTGGIDAWSLEIDPAIPRY